MPRRGWARSFLLLFGMYSHIVIVHYMTNEEETLGKKCQEEKGHFLALSISLDPQPQRKSSGSSNTMYVTCTVNQAGILRPKRKKAKVNGEEI